MPSKSNLKASSESEKVYVPLPPPDHLYRKDPLPPLTPRERETYKEVLEHFSEPGYKLPGVSKGNDELTDDEKFWLSYECILRFLRGSRWKPSETIQRIENTLKWRREFGLYTKLTPECVEKDGKNGTQILLGYDTQGRPGFYMIPNKQSWNSSNESRHLQYCVFMLERCIDLMPPGVEAVNLLVTYTNTSSQPSLSYTRTLLNTLQTHYPERLSHASLSNTPLILTILLKFVLTFIDPITRSKFTPDPSSLLKDRTFTPQQLMKQTWGGTLDFEYHHDKYWKELIRITDERRERWKERWRALGSAIGTREWRYKRDEGASETTSVNTSAEATDDRQERKLHHSPSTWVVVDDTSGSGFWGSLWGHHGSNGGHHDLGGGHGGDSGGGCDGGGDSGGGGGGD
ncbi:hypothetical protein NP233_g420 [Leucocoprinus birnbaumii]|uniref:CRAL-TRIO domain-containing protein n=1 Tax=Leucocoprinus birnbaumii TaxID=56174 RepID=A0AAD5Z0B8_9AGAR|nr:hypothetical protein NP233_g420 [Leucocoprinus birnbaumii]